MKELRTTATHSSHETRIEQQDSLLSQETTESLHCDEGDHDIGEPLMETVAVSSAEVQTELTSEFLCHLQSRVNNFKMKSVNWRSCLNQCN